MKQNKLNSELQDLVSEQALIQYPEINNK